MLVPIELRLKLPLVAYTMFVGASFLLAFVIIPTVVTVTLMGGEACE